MLFNFFDPSRVRALYFKAIAAVAAWDDQDDENGTILSTAMDELRLVVQEIHGANSTESDTATDVG